MVRTWGTTDNLMGMLRTAKARWSSVILSNLILLCSIGSQSTFLKNWLDDVGWP